MSCINSPTCPVDKQYHSCRKVWFRLLTWNIDGLDERNTLARTRAVCTFVEAKLPHVVFLQEVIPDTMREIVKRLEHVYDCYSPPDPPVTYFVAILVRTAVVKTRGPMQCHNFESSSMGRHLLQLPISYAGIDIELFTSHLESTKGGSKERMRQLKFVFDIVAQKCSDNPDISCLFGGDLNLRDNEVSRIGLPQGMLDVWEAVGSPASKKFTWDLRVNDNLDWKFPNRPSARFDRLFLMRGLHEGLKVPEFKDLGLEEQDREDKDTRFELVGKVRLSKCGNRFPSDHWGIWAEFIIDYPERVAVTR